MNFTEFLKQFVRDLQRELEKEFGRMVVEENHIRKLQLSSYHGITVRQEHGVIGISIDVFPLFLDYQGQKNYQEVLDEGISRVKEGLHNQKYIGKVRFGDYQKMKKKLLVRLVPTRENQEVLDDIVHREIEDLSMVYCFRLEEVDDVNYTMFLTKEMLNQYGVSEEQIHQDAMRYAQKNAPALIRSIYDVLGLDIDDSEKLMYVVGVNREMYGAAALFYPGILERIAQLLEGDFYILPSSIHEVIVIMDDGLEEVEELEAMVREINTAEVEPKDRLSNNVYHYDQIDRIFETGKAFIERKKNDGAR